MAGLDKIISQIKEESPEGGGTHQGRSPFQGR